VTAHRANNFWRPAVWQCERGLQDLLTRIPKTVQVSEVDSAEKPSWSKNPKFLGDQITLPISQKPVHWHLERRFSSSEDDFLQCWKSGEQQSHK
jgi:hypothetical protein